MDIHTVYAIKDNKEKCDKYNFLYFITNSILT